MSGKGDDRRPAQVPDDELEWRWLRAFGTTTRRKGPPPGALRFLPTPHREEAARRIGQLEMFEGAE